MEKNNDLMSDAVDTLFKNEFNSIYNKWTV